MRVAGRRVGRRDAYTSRYDALAAHIDQKTKCVDDVMSLFMKFKINYFDDTIYPVANYKIMPYHYFHECLLLSTGLH